MKLKHLMSRERSLIQKNIFCVASFITSIKTFLISQLEMRIVVTFGEGREETPEWFLVLITFFLELVCDIHFMITQ